MNLYHVFGFTLASDYTFAYRLAQGTGLPDVTFERVTAEKARKTLPSWHECSPVFVSPYRFTTGEAMSYLYRLPTYDILHFPRNVDLYLGPDHILWHPLNPIHTYMVEPWLLGPGCAFWLERQGIPVLHASAVALDQGAVVFLSSSKGGKSTLAAMLMQAGYPLLTDDVLPIRHIAGRQTADAFWGQPGYPTMRMWPAEAQHFLGGYETLELVHPELSKRRVLVGEDGFGTFCAAPRSLTAIYLPERHDTATWSNTVNITLLSPRDAVIALVQHSFVPRIAQAVGLQPKRLDFFARLIARVPVYRLQYPSGFAYLPYVRDALLEHIAHL